MNKICTSIDQSERLLELEFDVKTADIIYNIFDKSYIRHDTPIDKYHTPAWSLSALSKFILPSIMDDNKNVYKFYISKDDLDRWIAYYKSNNVSIHICEESDNMIDVIFEMVCWLKKEKYI